MKFTTRDRDNDNSGDSYNCAVHDLGGNTGGWWYKDCSHIFPNHQYNSSYSAYLNRRYHSFPFIEIKIRSLNCYL